MWFKFLYFLRVFRLLGSLIKTIKEVIVDIKAFLIVLVLTNLAFSGTFYILSQNNDEEPDKDGDKPKHSGYLGAIASTYELMLG